MDIVVWQFRHRFHHNWKLLHTRNILNYVQFWPSDGNMTEEMQEQIISGAHAVNIGDRRIFGARIRRHHYVAVLVSQDEFPCDVALNSFVRKVLPHSVTTDRVDLEALLQSQSARFKTDIHKPSAREVGVN